MRLHPLRVALILILVVEAASPLRAAQEPAFNRSSDVIYGRKFGMALTMEVFAPKKDANGAAVVWVVSGGWFSARESAEPTPFSPVSELVKRGYTVFAVVHGSQPKFTIPEILQDMNRAVRFIRSRAADYKIDPDRIGITGGSAGGHLSLMQGMAGDLGDPKAKDPVLRVSSRVQCVACFFPPTDFLNYGGEWVNALGRGILADFKAPFAFVELEKKKWAGEFVPVTEEAKILEIGKRISPVNHVTPDDPPSLINHGDADKLVPIQQAELIIDRLKKAGVACDLVVKKGAAHGWPKINEDMKTIAGWVDKYLAKK